MATYLSHVLDAPLWNAQAARLGKCLDLIVLETDRGAPVLRAILMLAIDGSESYISATQLSTLSPAIILNVVDPQAYELRGDELFLRRQVLDRQIVDVEGHRLVRVNDLQLTRVDAGGRYYLTGVSVGTSSMLRRLGVENLSSRVLRAFGRELGERVIPWQDVAPVQADAPIRLRVTQDKIRQLNPVDIAEIIGDMDRPSGLTLLNILDDETAADTMSEIEPDLQISLLMSLAPERAADVLEEMDPDDAADLLASMEVEQRESYLELMEDPESVEMVRLLSFPDDTAGGIMTTEFTTLPMGFTAGDALNYLRHSDLAHEDETLYYVHVVDQDSRLRGMLSLRDLVMLDPQESVDEIMDADPITVSPLVPQEEVARIVARYNLLEVPVVNEEGVIQGIVTVDDAIDAVIPTAWKKRLPRFY
ncbi:MAG: magnesium transporter [Chloroflexi bacterium]|nr:magnesium transporter [Chloroflexota bacterium]